MAKTLDRYITTKAGRETAGPTSRYLKNADGEGKDRFYPASTSADRFETVDMGLISTNGSGPSATGTTWTLVLDNSGTAAPAADGWLLTTGAASGNKILARHVRRLASGGANKVTMAKYRIQLSDITTSTCFLGFFNSSSDPVGTAPTNGVFFTITNGAIVGNVRGASGTLASTGTLATMVNTTAIEIDVKFFNSGVAATSWGEFYVTVGSGAPVRTPFTAAQITQLIAMTGDLFHHYHLQTTSAAVRTMTVDFAWPCYDR